MEELYHPEEDIAEFLVTIGALSPEKVEMVRSKLTKAPEMSFGEAAIELGVLDDHALRNYLTAKINA